MVHCVLGCRGTESLKVCQPGDEISDRGPGGHAVKGWHRCDEHERAYEGCEGVSEEHGCERRGGLQAQSLGTVTVRY